ncbi:P-loop containing nucleoside triphosphate hydrolase protein [Rhizophagus irregularis]|uniref:P-loop containing nucleoside triphosphate hydrolase protein n=1 Tax=Rhizophagus irregularis TaxID=588596 RepID=A0A2N0PX95_9GLOM|nr:P-loop containing nucleoside triphosphate hydrolase protein [Rhizophagus irregularis]
MSDIMNKEEIIREEIVDDISPTRTNTYVEDNRDTIFSDISNSTLVESIPRIITTNVDGKEKNVEFTTEEQYNGKRKTSIYKPVQKPPLQVSPTSVFHIFRFATSVDYFLMTLGMFFSVLSGLLIPLMTHLLGKIFGAFTDKQIGAITNQVFKEKIKTLLFQFSLLGVGSFVLMGSMITCWMWTGERQSKKMKQIYFKSLLRMEIAYFERDDVTSGGLLTSVNKDTEDVQAVISEHMGYLIQDVVTVVSTFVLAFISHAILTLVILASMPLLLLSLAYTSRRASPLIVQERDIFVQAGNVLENALSAIKTIRAFNGEEKEEKKHQNYLQAANSVSSSLAWTYGLRSGLTQFLILSLFVQGFWFGATLVANKRLAPGEVLSVFYSAMLGLGVLKNILPRIVSIERGKNAVNSINILLEKVALMELEALRGFKLSKIEGNIEFNQVSFSYPSRPDTWVLRNIDLYIPAYQTTVFVGESGSGKSTITQLIQRLYEPEEGLIMLDGRELRILNISWLRQQIGVVSQEPVLFDDTIFANVAYGRADYWNTTMKEVEDACKLACIHDFIMELPQGYDTGLGDMGKKLSGGQRQRIAIARALIKDPAILILDEASSALDMTSDHMVQKALENCRKNRTTIVVTHQLKHIGDSDLVYVMNEGEIVESGTKSQLLDIKNGYYNKLSVDHSPNPKRRTPELDSINKRLNSHESQQICTTPTSLKAKRVSAMNFLSADLSLSPPPSATFSRKSWYFEDPMDMDMLQGSATAAFSKRNEINDNSTSINDIISYYEDNDDGVIIDVLVTNPDESKSENTEQQKFKFPIIKLIRETMDNKSFYYIGIIATVINGLVMPAFSFVLANLLNTYSIADKDKLMYESRKFALYVLLIAIINGISTHFKYYLLERASERWAVRLRHLGFGKVLRQPQSWFDKPENATGKVTTILTTDTESSKNLIGQFAGNIILGLISLFGGIIWAFAVGWQLTLVGFGLVPLLLIISELQGFILQKYEKSQKLATENAANSFYQTISSLRTVFSLAIEPAMENKFHSSLEKPYKIGVKKAFICGFTSGFLDSLSYLTKVVTFGYGAKLVSDGVYDLQTMLVVWTLVIFCTTSASQMLATIPYYAKSKQAIKTIDKIINLPVTSNTEGIKPNHIQGTIVFKDVKFSYPERPDTTVLNGLDLTIHQGQTVALVGKSGNGKSTVAALLQRIYEPTHGSIMLDYEDLKGLELRWLRENVGIVSQEPVLFDMTIAENISYGKDDATKEEIETVAKQVNLHEFILNLPNGYDTKLGSCGSQLSGGQKQRIAIARVLLIDPKILILDEATSALDTTNEAIVQETLSKVQKGRTTLVITHRLKSVKNSDKIALVEGGKILESGTHKELMTLRGEYFELVRSGNL